MFSSAHRRVRALVAGAALVFALLLAGCGGSETQQADAGYTLSENVEDSTIAAIVEAGDFSDTLSYARLQREMNQLTRGRLAMFPDSVQQQVQQAALMRFLDTAAQIAEARERDLQADSAAVNAQLQRLRMRMGGDSLFQARLTQSGLSMAELRENIRQQLLARNLQQELANEAETPTGEEVASYRRDQAREVRVDRILFQLPPRASQAQRDSVQQRARAVLDSIQNDAATFASMAQRYGRGPGAQQGYQSRAQLAAPFARRGQPPEQVPFVQAAFALQDSGAVTSEPVRAGPGYYLLRQAGARTGTLMDSARAAQQLTRQRKQEVVTQAVEGLRENVTLRVNPSRITADMSQVMSEEQSGEQSEGA